MGDEEKSILSNQHVRNGNFICGVVEGMYVNRLCAVLLCLQYVFTYIHSVCICMYLHLPTLKIAAEVTAKQETSINQHSLLSVYVNQSQNRRNVDAYISLPYFAISVKY
jgi:hypothetical protein